MLNDAEAKGGVRARVRSGRLYRSPGARLPRPPRPPAPSRDLLETIGLALALTEPDVAGSADPTAGSPTGPTDAIRRLRAARDEFVGLVSHELRTPVTTIYGNARLLLDRQDAVSGEIRPMLVDIVQEAERLLGIVENLLLLTRARAGSPDDREPLALGHVVRRTCRSFSDRRGREVLVEGPTDPHILVEADESHIELLLENLLGNADKFSLPDRPIDVRVGAVGGEAVVQVLDSGIGLGEGSPEDLFVPFYRGSVASRITGGMGLGLAVARRIVEGLGGRVWAVPRLEGGTEVGFALPLLPDPGP
jgi:signal transduction histidine kinase